MKSIYLAGPIGKQTLLEANVWREKAEEFFDQIPNVKCANPLRGKNESEREYYTDNEIVFRDKNDIRNGDLVLAYWPERTVSNGTAMEIGYAHDNMIPVMFVGSWAKNDVWVRYHSTNIFDTLNEALDYIMQMWL